MLQYDREFAVVDSFGTALRLNSHPKLMLIEPVIDMDKQLLIVRAPNRHELVIDISQVGSSCSIDRDVHVCGSVCSSIPWGNVEVSKWFSSYLEVPCWLARYKRFECHRNREDYPTLSSSTIVNTPHYAFANEAPILLVSQESVDILNRALKQQSLSHASTKHFRPNLVVRSATKLPLNLCNTNPEDSWISLAIPRLGVSFGVSGRCNRCSMVDIDPSSGMKGQTLKTLAQYRRDGGNITFGVFLSLGPDQNTVIDCTIQEGEHILITTT